MTDINMVIHPGQVIPEVLRSAVDRAIAESIEDPTVRIILPFGTMCSQGMFIIDGNSDYDTLLAAYEDAQNHKNSLNSESVVIGP